MAAARYDIYIEQGATFEKTITWKDSSGAAIDLTGYTARMQIRKRIGSTTAVFSATTADFITLGGVAGTVKIVIPAVTTAAFDFGFGVYDLELISMDSHVYRLLEGGVELSKEVTR